MLELSEGWAPPLAEVRPQAHLERQKEVGFELVLDFVVPLLGRELVEVLNVVCQVVEQNVGIPVRCGGGGRPENFKDLSQDRVQQPRLVKVFKVFLQDKVSVEVHARGNVEPRPPLRTPS